MVVVKARKVILIAVLILSAIGLISSGFAKGHASEAGRCINLLQKSSFCGDSESLICPLGMRISLPKQNLVVINRRADKDVIVLNTRTKQYYKGPARDWVYHSKASALLQPSDASQLTIGNTGRDKLMNLNCIKFQLKGETPTQKSNGERIRKWERLLVKSAEMWSLPKGTVTAEAAILSERIFSTPKADLYPLEMVLHRNDSRNTDKKNLELLKQSDALCNVEKFEIPSGYIRLKDSQAVMFGSLKDNLLDEFLK